MIKITYTPKNKETREYAFIKVIDQFTNKRESGRVGIVALMEDGSIRRFRYDRIISPTASWKRSVDFS